MAKKKGVAGPQTKFIYKGSRKKKDPKVSWPCRVKGIIARFREVDDMEDQPAPELYQDAIDEYNEYVTEQRAAGNTKAKFFNYVNDPDDERLRENGGDGSVKLLPVSCRNKHAGSRLWGLADGFLGMLNNPKNKSHKEAKAIQKEFSIELETVEVDSDGNIIGELPDADESTSTEAETDEQALEPAMAEGDEDETETDEEEQGFFGG